jgi:hypothetical protein
VSLGDLGVADIALLVFLGVGLGIVIHPIQFALVQFFEGYWGTWPISQAVRYRRIIYYQQHCRKLNRRVRAAKATLYKWEKEDPKTTLSKRAPIRSEHDEAKRVRAMFPLDLDEVMPTRLGNVLRRAESLAGSQYGIDALQSVEHLLLIAPPDHIEYVNDQRSQLDLAVRMTFIAAMAAVTTIIFLCRDGAWVLVAVFPYLLAYCSYRGSVVAAGHYGSALETLINLNRFTLYQQLHVRLPASTADERKTNAKLRALLDYDPDVTIAYEHPASGDGTKSTA